MANKRPSKPDFGLGFEVKILETLEVVPASLGNGSADSQTVQRGPSRARARVQSPVYMGYLVH